MIDFHSHTFFSDGVLVPSELVRRATVKGYRALAVTDHVDGSNIDFVVPRIVKVARALNHTQETIVIPGVEITHTPPALIAGLVTEARQLGAVLVVVHGETIVEPVPPGTNLAAIEAGADILAHPGLLTDEEAKLAAENSIFLEITSRSGHSLTNGHVARLALENGASLVINTDSHSPEDLIDEATARKVLHGAGLNDRQTDHVMTNNEDLLTVLKLRL